MKPRKLVGYDEVDDVVQTMQEKGVNVRWEGWDIVIHNSDPRAFMSKNGKFYNSWGFERRIKPRAIDGKWSVPLEHANI